MALKILHMDTEKDMINYIETEVRYLECKGGITWSLK